MNKKIIFSFCSFLLVLTMLNLASGEITFWQNTRINQNDLSVTDAGYYQFYDDIETLRDTAFLDIKKALYQGRTIDIFLSANIEAMPYNTTNYIINYCEFNITHSKAEYDNEGNLLNMTDIIYGYVYNSTPVNTTEILITMKNRDSLVYGLSCYYNDSAYLFDESILFGRVATYFPAHKCNDCTQYSLEELSNEIERADEITEKELSIYNLMQEIVNFNFKIWLYVAWIVKIGFLILGVSLIFLGIYWMYQFIKDIERRI